MNLFKFTLFFLIVTQTIIVADIPRVYWTGPKYSTKIALTIDDGPTPYKTKKLLSILKRSNIKATFFLVGVQAVKYPDLVYQIKSEGHELANHSYSHTNLTELNRIQIINEIIDTNSILTSISNRAIKYIRPPGGNYNTEVIEIINELNMKMVLWDVNASDYIPKSLKYKFITDPNLGKRPGIKDSLYIKNFILKKIKGGSIILVHNGALESMKSLGEIIEKAQFNGFQFVTLSELFK